MFLERPKGLTILSILFNISNQYHKVDSKTIRKILDDMEIDKSANSGQVGQSEQSGTLSI